jgi:hypothetical protein
MPTQGLIQHYDHFTLTFLATTFKPEHTIVSQNLTQCLEWAVKQTFLLTVSMFPHLYSFINCGQYIVKILFATTRVYAY